MIFATRCVGVITQGQTRWRALPHFSSMPGPGFYAALANSILAGDASADAIAARLIHTLGRKWRWILPLVRRYLARFAREQPDSEFVLLKGEPSTTNLDFPQEAPDQSMLQKIEFRGGRS